MHFRLSHRDPRHFRRRVRTEHVNTLRETERQLPDLVELLTKAKNESTVGLMGNYTMSFVDYRNLVLVAYLRSTASSSSSSSSLSSQQATLLTSARYTHSPSRSSSIIS